MRTALRSSRVRKWLAFVLFVTMLAGWLVTFMYSVRFQNRKGDFVVVMDGGGVVLAWYELPKWRPVDAGWQIGPALERREGRTWFFPQLTHPRPRTTWLHVPLPPVILLFTGVVCWLFWKDHPPPMTHCRLCGYDMRGNISGICPECGTPKAAKSSVTEDAEHAAPRKEEGDDTR